MAYISIAADIVGITSAIILSGAWSVRQLKATQKDKREISTTLSSSSDRS